MKSIKLIIACLAIALLTYFGGRLTHWLSAYLIAGAVCTLLFSKNWLGFVAGFVGVALAWLGLHITTDIQNDHILYPRIAQLFQLNSSLLLHLVLGLIGGLLGGLGGWTFVALKGLFFTPRTKPA